MANRSWRNELNNRPYVYSSGYGNQMNYQNVYSSERRGYGSNRGGGYREDNKRGKREFNSTNSSSTNNRYDNNTPKKHNENNQSTVRRNYNTTNASTGGGAASGNANKKPISKYTVRPPKVVYDVKEGSISVLRSRYSKLYIPSDFFHSDFRWQEVFPLYAPMRLGAGKTVFQLFHRDVEPLTPFISEEAEPADANYIYSAKVMLLGGPEMAELVRFVCEGESESGDGNQYRTVNKSLQFLVGSKGKNEPLAIGGPWSASLDGPNPDEDPKVLINTAIRTCRQLTGIDLTPCRDWYRFIEFHYYRPADRQGPNISVENDENRTETELDFRVETVVMFVPSIWDCMPDAESWDELKKKYASALENIINPPIPEPAVEIIDTDEKKEQVDEKEEETEKTDSKDEKLDENAIQVDSEMATTESIGKTTADGTKMETDAIVVDGVEKAEVKELTDKDKKRFERLYKMNEHPSIVVHTNKTAKSGKFDCQLVSLASLLEYRSDDQKENTFEVSVFAEQFNEMIHRDAAFKIYKSLVHLPASAPSDQDKLEGEPDAKRKREDPSDNKPATDSTTASTTVASTKPATVPLGSDTLMAYCVWDTDHADYIKEHDLEEILHSIGLDLSRSQARKLFAKAVTRRGGIYYRELQTECPAEEDSICGDIELSKGNRSRLLLGGSACNSNQDNSNSSNSDSATFYLDSKTNTMSKIKSVETEIKRIASVFNENKTELENIRAHYHTAKDTENSLRSELKDLESRLYTERKNAREANQLQDIYNGLMRMSRDVLERAKSKIDRQFEKDAEKSGQNKAGADSKSHPTNNTINSVLTNGGNE